MAARERVLSLAPYGFARQAAGDGHEVVAVVMSDGTVRSIGDGPAGETGSEWATGRLVGKDWILWWERRALSDEGSA